VERLGTLVFHRKLGTYKEKSERIERLARGIAKDAFGASDQTAEFAARAARLSKADLTTDMVREFPELQGIMGGVYARIGHPEEIWKAIYFHYLPIGVEADAPPTKHQLGKAAVTWAAVSLADKLDTVVRLFVAGEKPTGSRDPFGIRRSAQGIVKILVDLPDLLGRIPRKTLKEFLDAALRADGTTETWSAGVAESLFPFMTERMIFVLENRGFDVRTVRAVTGSRFTDIRPCDELQKLKVLPDFVRTPADSRRSLRCSHRTG
jgi:glycyl-tRNA synthetase beta chain